jgi:hypothetical protein
MLGNYYACLQEVGDSTQVPSQLGTIEIMLMFGNLNKSFSPNKKLES